MSLYRFARSAALLALLRRYRQSLGRVIAAVSIALVTHFLYADIADFIAVRHPAWLGWALAIKTAVVYLALLVVLWELRRMLRGDHAGKTEAPGPLPLDKLADKPHLRSRREALLAAPPEDSPGP